MELEARRRPKETSIKPKTAAAVLFGLMTTVSPGEAFPHTAQEIINRSERALTNKREKTPWKFLIEAPNLTGIERINLPNHVVKASVQSPLTFYYMLKEKRFREIPGLDVKKQALVLLGENPHAFIAYAQDSKELFKDDWQELVEQAAASHPLVIEQAKTQELLNGIKEPKHKSTRVLRDIKPENRKGVVLLHDIVYHDLSEEEALARVNGDKRKLFTQLLRIESVPNHLGEVSVKLALRDYSLEKMQEAKKVAWGVTNLVDNYSAPELAALMVFGKGELDASTFKFLLSGITEKRLQENKEGSKPLDIAGNNRISTINEMAANFNVGGITEVQAADLIPTNIRQ